VFTSQELTAVVEFILSLLHDGLYFYVVFVAMYEYSLLLDVRISGHDKENISFYDGGNLHCILRRAAVSW
jgi:hypothetical protein